MNGLDVEPSACTWCGIAQRPHGRQYADAVGWHAWAQPSQEQILARMKARRLQLAVAKAGALPVPVGGVRTLDVVEEELTGVNLALWEEVQAYARLRLALTSAQRDRRQLRAEVAALLAERHSTNEALDDAVQELRARPSCPCPPADQPGPHQLGRPQAEAPSPLFPTVASLREVSSREEPHDSPLRQTYRIPHDLPLGCGLTDAQVEQLGQPFLDGGA